MEEDILVLSKGINVTVIIETALPGLDWIHVPERVGE